MKKLKDSYMKEIQVKIYSVNPFRITTQNESKKHNYGDFKVEVVVTDFSQFILELTLALVAYTKPKSESLPIKCFLQNEKLKSFNSDAFKIK